MELIGNRHDNRAGLESELPGSIVFNGAGSTVTIAGGCSATPGLWIEAGSNSSVTIGPWVTLHNLYIYVADCVSITVGSHAGFSGHCRLLAHEPGSISIGNGCLFGSNVEATISDMHSIVDVESGQRVNPARDIALEERVWVGQRTLLFKGSHIGSGSIVGAGAIVTGTLPPNSLSVGIPARPIRSGVTWRHELL